MAQVFQAEKDTARSGHLDNHAEYRLSSLRVQSQRPWTSKFSAGDAAWFTTYGAAFFLLIRWFRNDLQQASPAPLESASVTPLTKRAECGASSGVGTHYDVPFHVGALFIIWTVSTLACAFPLLALKFPKLHISQRFFFAVRHFGTGVLIATAFVHLLPTAFISLGDDCLSNFWVNDFPAAPGAICLMAIFAVTIVEMVFHPASGGGGCMGTHGTVDSSKLAMSPRPPMPMSPSLPMSPKPQISPWTHLSPNPLSPNPLTSNPQISVRPELRGHHRNDTGYSCETLTDDSAGSLSKIESSEKIKDLEAVQTSESALLTPEQQIKKEKLQCMLLELGILFHSVFIGMALSVSVGDDFMVLLIAIIFHQTFEGLALGSRISAINWPKDTNQPWFMAMAYGCTTPIGQAIGIATHTLYSPDSETGLVMVGVMNAISSGLLTYASLVELLGVDFLSDESWKILRGKKRVVACLLVFFGAFCMSLVGAWA